MKKILLVSMIAILAVSCKQEPGTVTGVVTFFFNEYQGYKPDIGAKVYITSENCDSIDNYLSAFQAKERIQLYNYYIEEYKTIGESENKESIDDLYKSIESEQKTLNNYAKDSTVFKLNEEKAFLKFNKITTNKDIYKTTVDGSGNFTIDVPPGKYNVIIVSVGRTKVNLLEHSGQILIKAIEVKSKEKTSVDAKFEL